MDNFFSKIEKENLSPDEKSKILSSLKKFAADHPAAIKSPFYGEWFVVKRKILISSSIFVVAILMLTGGTVLAAKNSVPGNVLYPVKMLKENVESIIAPNAKIRAQVEASHAITRLQEVEQIVSSKQDLEKGLGQQISNDFGSQAKNMTESIKTLRENGQNEEAAKIQSDFKKSLAEHEDNIKKILSDTSVKNETKEELSHVYSDVHSQIEKTQKQEHEEQVGGEVKGAQTENENNKDGSQEKQDQNNKNQYSKNKDNNDN